MYTVSRLKRVGFSPFKPCKCDSWWDMIWTFCLEVQSCFPFSLLKTLCSRYQQQTMSAGAVARFPPIAVKLKGAIAATKPCNKSIKHGFLMYQISAHLRQVLSCLYICCCSLFKLFFHEEQGGLHELIHLKLVFKVFLSFNLFSFLQILSYRV